MFCAKVTSEQTLSLNIRYAGNFGRIATKESWISVIAKTKDLKNMNFQIIPNLSSGQSVKLSNIGIYVVEDNCTYVPPMIEKNGDEMYGNLKFVNGNIILKDSSNGRYYKLVSTNGVLSLVNA